MTFEEKLIKAGQIRQKNLHAPAQKASNAPDTGVTILKKSAYYVIKDCADVTEKYLPHLVYSSMSNPLALLKGKFTKSDIMKFVGRADEQPWTKQLLNIILTDVGTVQYRAATGRPTDEDVSTGTPVFDYADMGDADIDVYGDYNNEGLDDPVEDDDDNSEDHVDVEDATAIIEKLMEVFDAK
jgi:hypothetical protein